MFFWPCGQTTKQTLFFSKTLLYEKENNQSGNSNNNFSNDLIKRQPMLRRVIEKNCLFACLFVCPRGQKNIFHKSEIIHNSEQEGGRRPTASCRLRVTLQNSTENWSIHTWEQTTTAMTYINIMQFFFHRAVCLRIAFNRKVEKN